MVDFQDLFYHCLPIEKTFVQRLSNGGRMASIRKHGTKWQVRIIRRGYTPISKSFVTKPDAERWSRKIETQIDQGSFVDTTEAQRTTVADIIERYRLEVTPKKKGAKQEGYRLNVLLRAKVSHLTLAKIRSTDIARFRDERSAVAAANTVKNEINTLSAIFEFARCELGLIATNPCRAVKRPTLPQGRKRRLSPGEEVSLLTACHASRAWYLHSVVVLAIETAARLSELTDLHFKDIDLTRAVAHLRNTKNGDDRIIPLSRKAVACLQTMPRSIDGRLISVHKESVKQAFRAAVKRCGLPDMHFHDLRHEAVSRLFERGLNVMEVAAISGHKTLQMLKRYTHLNAEELARKLG